MDVREERGRDSIWRVGARVCVVRDVTTVQEFACLQQIAHDVSLIDTQPGGSSLLVKSFGERTFENTPSFELFDVFAFLLFRTCDKSEGCYTHP